MITANGQNGITKPSGAAKVCTAEGADPGECTPTDPAYPGHTYTGNCVKATLVFGFTSEDDMCILPGYYYDADPTARGRSGVRPVVVRQRRVPVHGSRARGDEPAMMPARAARFSAW